MRQGDAGVAHPVERHLAKVEVASSSLVTRSKPIHSDGFLLCLEDFNHAHPAEHPDSVGCCGHHASGPACKPVSEEPRIM